MRYPEDFMNKLICGDCLEVMKTMPDNCIDTIITDPPYGLKFMGKKWDNFRNSRIAKSQVVKNLGTGMRQTTLQENINFMEWTSMWAKEALRILKPGGTMLCFAGSRTQHLVAFGIELAGWILKDCIMWIYGSGFPKATDISKQIDKRAGKEREIVDRIRIDGKKTGKKHNWVQSNDSTKCYSSNAITPEAKLWNGWKSHGLKPAYEPILICMKPNEGSYANNALRWGVAGINVDGGRVEISDKDKAEIKTKKNKKPTSNNIISGYGNNTFEAGDWNMNKGRYPANCILSCFCDDYYLMGNVLYSIIKEKIKEILCQSRNLSLSVNNVENKKSPEDMTSEIKSWFSAVGNVNTNILEKILGKLLDDISKMDIGCSEKILEENINISLNMFTCGKNIMARYQEDMKCTISTVRKMITVWKIYNVLNRKNIKVLLIKTISGIQEQKQELLHNDDCPIKMLDEQSGISKSGGTTTDGAINNWGDKRTPLNYIPPNVGGSSRFFYCAKASKSERNRGCERLEEKEYNQQVGATSYTKSTLKEHKRDSKRQNNHPTVKPLSLMKYLCTLTKTPTGGLVLDPFCGSGTTLMACKELKRDYIGIDNIPEYCEIARRRVNAIPESLF
ncbi:hypothetical protein ES705_27161 [subsurface metagenome]